MEELTFNELLNISSRGFLRHSPNYWVSPYIVTDHLVRYTK